MNWIDRRLLEWGKRRGFYPEPSLGLSSIGGLSLTEDAPADYLTYARTSNVVYACATLRARMLSGLPIKAYRFDGSGGGRMVATRHPRARLGMPASHTRAAADAGQVQQVEAGPLVTMLANVNPDWTWRGLIYMTELSLCLAGQAFWLVDDGEVWFVKHTRMAAIPGTDRPIAGWTLDAGTSKARALEPEQVIWLRYPDPADPDYGVLPPMAAARLGADSYSAAMKANKAIFDNGINAAGLLMPGSDAGGYLTPDQLQEIAKHMELRLKGADKAHRIGVVPYNVDIKQLSISPKDAEFQALLDFSIEDVGRAFGVPVEFIGGSRRTYQNLENAMVAIWMQTLEPEAAWLADELTEKLVMQFPGQADFIAFDLSSVSALQADETAQWAREKEQVEVGLLLPNEWRTKAGMTELPQAGASMTVGAQTAVLEALSQFAAGQLSADQLSAYLTQVIGLTPEQAAGIISSGPPAPPPPPPAEPAPVAAAPEAPEPPEPDDDERAAPLAIVRDAVAESRDFPAYGSREHETMWRAAVARPDAHEAAVRAVVVKLLERQRDAIVARLGGKREARLSPADLAAIFQRPRWVREFREAMRKALTPVMADAAKYVGESTGGKAMSANDPAAIRFLMRSSQRFAEQVNETTWRELQDGLAESMKAGAPLPDLAKMVDRIMGDRIRSSAEAIARTETLRAWNGGSVIVAKATGLELDKTWVSALDERVRDHHRAAHGQTVPIDEDFTVGGEQGSAPGDFPSASNVVNCRCVVTYSERTRAARPATLTHEVTHG